MVGVMQTRDDIAEALAAGQVGFMGRRFLVAPGVLVPRAVSEVVIRAATSVLEPAQPAILVDMCTGGGCLAVTAAWCFPSARVYASDLSEDAVALARRNVAEHRLEDRVEVRRGDLFAPLADLAGTVDAILVSPPFISSGKLSAASAHLLAREPRAAFDGGPYGISLVQRIVKDGAALLRPGSGWLVCELGEGQDRQVVRLVERAGEYEPARTFASEAGFVACVAARRRAP
jgi:release factor glutamine methyltransferase